ncbi:MAG: VWA domain-containing protein [Candidatus Cloacimonetes bacterium]|nr:VWA domain-containing protein [Candidatus Cloacimonadota bacterium]
MTNKNIYISIAIIFFLFLFQTIEIKAESSDNDIYFFLVDISRSMKDVGLDVKVKKELQYFISKEVPLGSSLLIIGFGEKISLIYDDKIDNVEDKERIYNQFSFLDFNEDWTHMSAAFDRLAKRLNELHKLYPNTRKYIYIFTDGKNQPPSYLGEKPEHFKEILNKYFSPNKIDSLNSYIYYISFGTEAPEEISDMESESERVKVVIKPEVPEPEPIIPKEIKLELEKERFKLIQAKKESFSLHFKIISITKACEVKAKLDNKEEELLLTTKMNDFNITYTPDDLSEGKHKFKIEFTMLNKKGTIKPNTFVITYIVKIPNYTFWYILGAILLAIIIFIIIYKSIPSFHGELIFIKDGNEFPKRLYGKSCKSINDLRKGWGIPPSIKVCPDSSKNKVKIKFSLSPNQKENFTKNGMPVSKSPIILRSGDSIEYAKITVRYQYKK